MGVRFHKTVKLGKAAHLNFSKSGVGLSLGVPGACVSIGPTGTLLSLGVPGTGLSYRKTTTALKSPISRDNVHKIAGQGAKTLPTADQPSLPDPAVEEVLAGELGAGAATAAGRELTADEQVRLQIAARLSELGMDPVGFGVNISVTEDGRERFVNSATGEVITDFELLALICKMDAYKAMRAQIAEYRQAAVAAKARQAEARTDELVNVFRLAPVVAPRDDAMALAGEALPGAFAADEEEVLTQVNRWLATVAFPADIAAHFDFADGWLWVDLDLPEIEALPTCELRTLKSGQVKEVAKTQKKLREEYAKLVFGTGLFLAASAVSLHFAIDVVVVSAYTQRRDADGDISDDYIYSVAIPRAGLESRIIEDPEAVFLEFPNRLRLSATKVFSVVKPFSPEDRPSLEARLA